jgi:hypothetical protein
MNEIKNENRIKLEELAKHVKSGNCILFLGAGVHAPPPEDSKYKYPDEQRIPLGRDLSQKLADEFGYKKVFCDHPCERPQSVPPDCDRSCQDLQRVSLYIETEKAYGRKKLVDALDMHLRENKKPSPALKMLSSMPFKIFVTTNYDRLLEAALNKFEKDPVSIVYNCDTNIPTPDMTEDPTKERPLLFKMHGDLNQRESIVITDEDYIIFVQRMSDKEALHPVPQTVRFRMRQWPTLFVGYSLRDYNLRLMFRTLRWRVDTVNFPTSFAVDRNPDPLTLQVWQNERKIIAFVAQDLWTFAPWLYKEVHGKEFQDV